MALLLEEEQRFMQAEQDQQYVLREFDSLKQKFQDEYIGVMKGQVKFHNTNIDNLLAAIRSELGSTKGVFVFFIPSKHRTIAV